MPGTIDVLLKNGTNGCVGGIGHEAGCGYESSEAFARASFVALKEATAASVQRRDCDFGLQPERREWSGCMRSAQ